MAAAIAWSYELLDNEERHLFARLAIFAGGCVLSSAEAICEADLDTLQSLVDKSLLRRRGDRFLMLETIREYGREQLEQSGEADRLGRRHAEFFLAFAERGERALRSEEQSRWLARLEAEIGNLRAAWEWFRRCGEIELELRLLGSLVRFWASRGHVREGWQLLNDALARRPSHASPALVRALGAAAWLAEVQGEQELSETWSAERIDVARGLGDKTEVIHGLAGHAIARLNSGDVAGALELFEEGASLARETGDPSCVAPAVGNLAAALLIHGDHRRSRDLSEEALGLARTIGDARWIAGSLANLGWALLGDGGVDEAAARFGEAFNLASESGVTTDYPEFLEGLAAVALARGDASRAAVLLGAADGFRSVEGLAPGRHVAERELDERDAARAALGAEAFDRAFAEGVDLSLEEAVSYALSDIPNSSDKHSG
jgi:predicted ATPase